MQYKSGTNELGTGTYCSVVHCKVRSLELTVQSGIFIYTRKSNSVGMLKLKNEPETG
jgi:hypothetical protein